MAELVDAVDLKSIAFGRDSSILSIRTKIIVSLCNGSTTHFDCVSIGSSTVETAKYIRSINMNDVIERKIFYIDVGDMPRDEVKSYIDTHIKNTKQQKTSNNSSDFTEILIEGIASISLAFL